MLLRKKQLGFSAVELVIILVVVALLGFAGYVVYNRMQGNKTASNSGTTDQSASDVKSAPAINSASDLDKASSVLDQTDPNPSSDSATLDAQLSGF